MISFRLTDEEYERFRRLCVERGLGNVSELVRTAVNQMLTTLEDGRPEPRSEIEFRVSRLEAQAADLSLAVEQLQQRAAGSVARSAST